MLFFVNLVNFLCILFPTHLSILNLLFSSADFKYYFEKSLLPCDVPDSDDST